MKTAEEILERAKERLEFLVSATPVIDSRSDGVMFGFKSALRIIKEEEGADDEQEG